MEEILSGLRSETQNLGCLCQRTVDACEATWVNLIWVLQLGVGFSLAFLKNLDSVEFRGCLILGIFEAAEEIE